MTLLGSIGVKSVPLEDVAELTLKASYSGLSADKGRFAWFCKTEIYKIRYVDAGVPACRQILKSEIGMTIIISYTSDLLGTSRF